MNKNNKLTRLADLIDDELIEEAIRAGGNEFTAQARKNRFSRTALIAACILISALLAVFSVSYIYRQVGLPSETTSPEHTDPFPLIPSPPDGEVIDTLDKLNYYGGIMSIMQSNSKNSFAYLPRPTSSISLLSGGDQPETIPNIPDEVTVTYTWGESESFTVTRAIYFRILLDSANFFLADRLGVGEAEVVITSNSIADMITFRRGGKYYSCVLKTKSVSESGEICYVFSTDNYIDGPYLINHSSVESIDFTVYISSDGIRMDSRKIHWDSIYAEIEVIDGTYRESDNSITLTAAEIAEFFDFSTAADSPVLEGDIEYVFCGRNPAGDVEIYLVIYNDGSLLWCNKAFMKNREDPAAYSRSGEISTFNREFIVFHYVDPQGEKVICNMQLTDSGGFDFMGMSFERRSTLAFDQSGSFPVLWFESRAGGAETLCLYAAENGLFTVGEKSKINPQLRWQDRKPTLEGSCRITESTATFAYFEDGKLNIQSINYKNGEPFVFGGREFRLSASPFAEEKTVRYVTREDSGMKCEIVITNDARYVISDIERGVTVDYGYVRMESDGKSFTLVSDPELGTFEELYMTPAEDGSIEHRRIRFYPEDSVAGQ